MSRYRIRKTGTRWRLTVPGDTGVPSITLWRTHTAAIGEINRIEHNRHLWVALLPGIGGYR